MCGSRSERLSRLLGSEPSLMVGEGWAETSEKKEIEVWDPLACLVKIS